MTPEQFVTAIRQVAFEQAANPTVLEPHGRAPHRAMLEVWEWYSGLNARDQALVGRTMRLAAWSGIFGVFAVLDGVRAIDDAPHGHLALIYVDASGQSHPLNDSLGSGPGSDLRDLWNAEVFPPEEPELVG
jgi:hypothetical protein